MVADVKVKACIRFCSAFFNGSGYFVIDGNLSLESILL